MRRWIALMIGVGGLSGSAGCNKECDAVGCENGAVVHFSTTFETPGMYVFSGTQDGKSFSCTADLAQRPAAGICDAPDVHVLFEPRGSVVSGVSFDHTPMKVVVRVESDGRGIASGESTLAYQDLQPNGEGCAPSCHFAEETITLSEADGGT